MYVRNGYDWDSETLNVLARHTALFETLNCHWNTLAQERSFLRIGYAKRCSSVDFCNEAVSLVWQGTKSLEKTCDWRRAYCTWSSFSQTRPLQHFLSVAHFATRRMLPVCEQLSSHVSLRHDCHGINVKPSGLFPSSLLRPWGSLTAGVSARIRAQLSQAWRWTLADCFLQDNACWLRGSTMTPQGQEWASQIAQPRRRPTATHMALLWRCRPQALSGRVWCQSPLWGAAAANNLALWYGSL